MSDMPQLLTPFQRFRYAITPLRLYARYRAHRYSKKTEPELDVLPYLVDPQRVSVDAGANRGSYTYSLARLTKHVYAYEPNPSMRQLLKRAVGENVTVSEVALSDRSGQADFAVPRMEQAYGNNAGSLEVDQLQTNHNDVIRFTVPTRRLDDENLNNVGFIKIDVEGHERQVLLGAQQLIARDRPVLLMEIIESLTGDEAIESVRFVEQMGYQCFVLVAKRLIDYSMLASHEDPGSGWDRRRPHHRSNNYIFLPVDRQRMAA
jgi:FkbM family methyltransferase